MAEITSRAGEYDRLAQQIIEELVSQLAPTGPWGKELDRLTQRVEELFRQATKRFAVPSGSDCRTVAFYLMALRSHPEKFRKKPAAQTKATRYGKLFLHHLAAERTETAYWIALLRQGRPVEIWLRRHQELLSRRPNAARYRGAASGPDATKR